MPPTARPVSLDSRPLEVSKPSSNPVRREYRVFGHLRSGLFYPYGKKLWNKMEKKIALRYDLIYSDGKPAFIRGTQELHGNFRDGAILRPQSSTELRNIETACGR
jgi:hypothetical protein